MFIYTGNNILKFIGYNKQNIINSSITYSFEIDFVVSEKKALYILKLVVKLVYIIYFTTSS